MLFGSQTLPTGRLACVDPFAAKEVVSAVGQTLVAPMSAEDGDSGAAAMETEQTEAEGRDHEEEGRDAATEAQGGTGLSDDDEPPEGNKTADADADEAKAAGSSVQSKDEGDGLEEGEKREEMEEGDKEGETAHAASDEEGDGDKQSQADADPVFSQRDKLRKIMDDETPDLLAANGILDALMERIDDLESPQIVLNREESLGMLVRRLRKHPDEDLATRAGNLYSLFRIQ